MPISSLVTFWATTEQLVRVMLSIFTLQNDSLAISRQQRTKLMPCFTRAFHFPSQTPRNTEPDRDRKDEMAPALQTSKRKFYKLLDGLNTSQTSLSSTNKAGASTTTLNEKSDGHAAKRSRMSLESRPSEDTRPNSVRVVGSSMSASTFGKSTRPSTSDSKNERPTPNYQPYSQPAFLERMRTFADVKVWTYKPAEISELHWAKRGWVCEGKEVDVVACKGGCEARVVVRLRRGRERAQAFEASETLSNGGKSGDTSKDVAPEPVPNDGGELDMDWVEDDDNPLVARYQELIVEGHRDGCLWRKAGCKDDIYRIRMADASTWQGELMERYQSLVAMESALPERLKFPDADTENEGAQERFTIDKLQSNLSSMVTASREPVEGAKRTVTGDIAATEASTTPSRNELNLTAITLAMFGWHGTSPHKIHLATCSRCFQRAGLWLYTSNPSNKALPASASGIADDNIMRFDLTGLHRDHCPWINPDSQAGLGQFAGLPAWEVLVQLIKSRSLRKANEQEGQNQEVQSALAALEGSLERSREEIEAEDRARDSKFARLKRAFTIKKTTNKLDKRKSWKSIRSAKSVKSSKSVNE